MGFNVIKRTVTITERTITVTEEIPELDNAPVVVSHRARKHYGGPDGVEFPLVHTWWL